MMANMRLHCTLKRLKVFVIQIKWNWLLNHIAHMRYTAMYVCTYILSSTRAFIFRCHLLPLFTLCPYLHAVSCRCVSHLDTVSRNAHCSSHAITPATDSVNIDVGCSSLFMCPGCCACALYTGCFTTLGQNCRRWFPRSLWSKKFI